MNYNTPQGFPVDPYQPLLAPLQVAYGQPPFIPPVPYPPAMMNTPVIPMLVSVIIMEIQNNMQKNNFRMAFYNLCSSNGWANKEFSDIVMYTAYQVDAVMQNQPQGVNAETVVVNVASEMISLFTSDLVTRFPVMQQFLNQQTAPAVYENSQRLGGIIMQLQQRMQNMQNTQMSNQYAGGGNYMQNQQRMQPQQNLYGGQPQQGNYFQQNNQQRMVHGQQAQTTMGPSNYFGNSQQQPVQQQPQWSQEDIEKAQAERNRQSLRTARTQRQREVQQAGLVYDPAVYGIEVMPVFDPRKVRGGQYNHNAATDSAPAYQYNQQPAQQQPYNGVQMQRPQETHHRHGRSVADILELDQPEQDYSQFPNRSVQQPNQQKPAISEIRMDAGHKPEVIYERGEPGIPDHYFDHDVDDHTIGQPAAGREQLLKEMHLKSFGHSARGGTPYAQPTVSAVERAEPQTVFTTKPWKSHPGQRYLPAYNPHKSTLKYVIEDGEVSARIFPKTPQEIKAMEYDKHAIGVVPKRHTVASVVQGEPAKVQEIKNLQAPSGEFEIIKQEQIYMLSSDDTAFIDFETRSRLLHGEQDSNNTAYRGYAAIMRPIVCATVDQAKRMQELLMEVNSCRTFDNAVKLLKSIDEAELLNVRTLVNDLLTKEVNKALSLNMSLPDWIDSFEEDATSLHPHLKEAYGDEIAHAWQSHESIILNNTISVLESENAAMQAQSQLIEGEGFENEEELRERVVYMVHYSAYNLLMRNAWELSLAMAKDAPVVIKEDEHADLYGLISSLFAEKISDYKNFVIQTKDGIRFMVGRGFLNRNSFLIKRDVSV